MDMAFASQGVVLCGRCSVGRCHTYFWSISKHMGSVFWLTELCKGVWNPGPSNQGIINNEKNHLAVSEIVSLTQRVPKGCLHQGGPESAHLRNSHRRNPWFRNSRLWNFCRIWHPLIRHPLDSRQLTRLCFDFVRFFLRSLVGRFA